MVALRCWSPQSTNGIGESARRDEIASIVLLGPTHLNSLIASHKSVFLCVFCKIFAQLAPTNKTHFIYCVHAASVNGNGNE